MKTREELVVLRTGAKVPKALVQVVLISLEKLMDVNPIALYELVMMARDPSHEPFGNTGEVLARFSLVERDGRLHSATRDVVLAASADGDGFDMHLMSPYGSAS